MEHILDNLDLNKQSLHISVKQLVRIFINDNQPEYLPSERVLQRRLGVSRTTIRKALQGLQHEKQLMVVHGKGYRVLYQTSGQDFCGRIGIAMVNEYDEYLNEVFRYMIDYILSKGFEPVVTIIGPAYENASEKLAQLIADVDGIICFSKLLVTPGVYESLKRDWFRIVALPYIVNKDFKTTCVAPIGGDAVKKLTTHLLRYGHRKIALFTSVNQRIVGFKRAFNEAGLEYDAELIYKCSGHRHIGYDMFGKLLASKRDFTAVMCQNDVCALGVMERCFKEKIKVPDEVSITGFDNIMHSELYPVPLTTVNINVKNICRVALDLLLKGISSGEVQQSCLIDSKIIIRSSVKKL